MSKTAEQVARDTLMEEWTKPDETITREAALVVSALRSAGWLREANEIPALVALEGYKRLLAEKERELCPGCYDRVTELTRERDEARKECAAAKADAAGWATAASSRLDTITQRNREIDALRASAASPEVMRVVDAVLNHKAAYWALYVHKPYDSPEWHELAESANALSASRQPKAQEPRYKAEGCEVWDTVQRQADGSRRLLCRFYGIAACGAAQEHAARLNGEGGGR